MNKYRFNSLLLVLFGVFNLPAQAQDLSKESDPVPQQQPFQAVPLSSDMVSQPAATDGNTALVRIDQFLVKGNTLLDAKLIERLLTPFKGNARSYTDIQLALEALEGAYRTAGYSAVHVITPEQEITQGIVTFQVIETVVGKITLKGNNYYDKKNIRNALPALVEGSTPSARKLSKNLRLANENTTRQLDVVLALGEEENTVDVEVNVQDNTPHKLFATWENTGSLSTGMYRTGIGYQNNNMFNLDQALTLNYVTSPTHVKDVTQLSASYRLPIYRNGDSVDLMAAYSNVGGTISFSGSNMIFNGNGHVYGAHYNHYLPRQGDYLSKVILGLDYRSSASVVNAGAPVIEPTVHPLSIGYGGTLTKQTHSFDYSTTLIHNLLGGKYGETADFNAVGKDASYTILHLNGIAAGILPRNWQYRLAGNAQYTHDVLTSGEGLNLVGANAVRGFTEGEFRSNKGYVTNIEFYTPELAQRFKLKEGSLRFLGFIDTASGWNDASNRTSLGSVGLGIRYGYKANIAVKLDLAKVSCNDTDGKTCTGTNVVSRTGDTRGHLAVTASW
jgi:hemolysin activation/secretion protein